jgi:hypothetical protein
MRESLSIVTAGLCLRYAGLALGGALLLCSCAVAPEKPEIRTVAYLPYIEAVELPQVVNSGEPFTLRLRLSTAGNPGVLMDGSVFLDRQASSGEGFAAPYVVAEPGGAISNDGWYEFEYTIHAFASQTAPAPARLYLFGAPDPAQGGLKGTVSSLTHSLHFLTDYRKLQFELLLNP